MKKKSDFFVCEKFIFNNPDRKITRKELRNKMTEAERLFWLMIKDRGLLRYKFRRQYGIGIFIVDFYCASLRLVIEIDGGQHNIIEGKDYDRTRSEYFKNFNIKVIRYWNNEILNNLSGVYDDLIDKIKLREKELLK